MSQEQAEKFLEEMAILLDLDTQIHRWEVGNTRMVFEAVETMPEVFLILVKEYKYFNWITKGIIYSYNTRLNQAS